jgi:hypothetical protein
MAYKIIKELVDIPARVDSPRILLDTYNSIFLIEGPSYPEDALEVYEIVLSWISQNNYQFDHPLNCEFNFQVLSSASRKLILEILVELEKAHNRNKNIRILWYYNQEDDDMKEAGEDLMTNVDLPFDIISI